ncbi:uncharacterized protein LOC127700794 [Mytilus californianus]|uniref:uncharacterized protein LOC127700794 n=1 Tax=Mytilus californianus TaxID=6549 RepID=UPI00224529D0|nr:uncharacterized protein LOC127700794 [Mytilus californianus]
MDSMTLNTLRVHDKKCYDRYGKCTKMRCKCGLAENTFIWTTNRSADVNFQEKNAEVICLMKFKLSNGHILDAFTGVIFNGSDFVPSPNITQYADIRKGTLKEGGLKILPSGDVELILKEDNHTESAVPFLQYVAILAVSIIVVVLTISLAIYYLVRKCGKYKKEGHARFKKYLKEHVELHIIPGFEETGICNECGDRTNFAICYEHKIVLCKKHTGTHDSICKDTKKAKQIEKLNKCSICEEKIATLVCMECRKFVCGSCRVCDCSNAKGSYSPDVLINNQTVTTYTQASTNEDKVSDTVVNS